MRIFLRAVNKKYSQQQDSAGEKYSLGEKVFAVQKYPLAVLSWYDAW
jgi:hypothetical protein